MLRRLELSAADHHVLLEESGRAGIELLSTPFDPDSARFLVEELGLRRLKIGSGDLTNGPLLLANARLGVRLILSTGLATLGEIEDALAVLAFGLVAGRGARPGRAAFAEAYGSPEGQAALAGAVTLLHCTTEYPCPFEAVNLRAMDLIGRAFALPVGYSDHTEGIAVSLAAVARGALVLEKHVTLDRSLPGPDHASSIEPAELEALVRGVRAIERALGDGRKWPMPAELPNRAVARKSVVAARPIAKGALFALDDLAVKRPGGGLSPMAVWELLGRRAARDFAPDETIVA